MSKAQGDGFRTWTNTDLNAYRKRLDAKLADMREKTVKWYDINGFWILAESWNVLENPNGDWKWNGWEVVGKEYRLAVFEQDVLVFDGDTIDVNGPSVFCGVYNDREEALDMFRRLKAM